MIPIEDLTEVTLAIQETDEDDEDDEEVMKVVKWGKLSSDEGCQVMKVVKWWKRCFNVKFNFKTG